MLSQRNNLGYLEEINTQFYFLIKELRNRKFAESSQIATLAYKAFINELSRKMSAKSLN